MVYKSGFVSIIGRPNVGKSTLINRIISEKISIISRRPQTTRNKIHAVYSEKRGQIIFVDTPGIVNSRNRLDEFMKDQAYKSLEGIDLIFFMVDGSTYYGKNDDFILRQLKGSKTPIIMIMNKIDRIK